MKTTEEIEESINEAYTRLDELQQLSNSRRMALVLAGEAYICADPECLTFNYGYNCTQCRQCGKDEWMEHPSELGDLIPKMIEERIIPALPTRSGYEWRLTRHWESPLVYPDNTCVHVLIRTEEDNERTHPEDELEDLIILGRTDREVLNTINAMATALNGWHDIFAEELE